MGNRYSIANAFQSALAPAPASSDSLPDTSAAPSTDDGRLTLTARNDGYFPRALTAKAGQEITLNVITKNTRSCAVAFTIPDLGVEVLLPDTGTTPITIPPQESGKAMLITCSMGMYTSVIEFK
jgi:plastocyanin domain-containing protein